MIVSSITSVFNYPIMDLQNDDEENFPGKEATHHFQ